jgi:hypothetical protein
MKLLTALTAVTILTAIAAAATPPAVTISIEENQRQLDMRTLPVTQIENLY